MTSTARLEFTGSTGEKLAARLDMPTFPPRAYALFAHCFTCSKDIFAASRIARGLTNSGIAVLRFDFTGLGASEGEFANTNFSSNIADLVAAADFMRSKLSAPQLLVGHSLGGAAVLAAASQIDEVRAVATLAAPAGVDHVLSHMGGSLEEIENKGSADVKIAGRSFPISANFVEDARAHALGEHISRLKRALLILHSPLDNIVSIDNATDIFVAAKHPKSFVSLDRADHLLSDHGDAVYAADVIAAWADRYISDETAVVDDAVHEHATVRVEETGHSKYQQRVFSGKHELLADEPASVGGADTGPSPYDYLGIALGACTTMTLRMYAEHKGYDIGRLAVDVSHAKVHADDCADCGEGLKGRIDRFERTISVAGDVPPEIRKRLVAIANKCPVHKTLVHSSVVATKLED